MISLLFKYLNPFWYIYGIPKGLIMSPYYLACILVWLWTTLKAAFIYGWNKFEPWYMKVAFSLFMLWCAWPLTNTWLFGLIMRSIGFEEEVDFVLELVYGVLIAAYRGLMFVWNYVDPSPVAVTVAAVGFGIATVVSWFVKRNEK